MPLIKKGDKIGIISPSNSVTAEQIELALNFFKEQGFIPVLGENVFKEYRWMAGTPQERVEDIHRFYSDPEIVAIFCSCGGAGAQKILEFIDYELIKRNPKPLFGFSDNTALQLAIYSKASQVSYTGFCMKYDFRFGKLGEIETKSFFDTINEQPQKICSGEKVIGGKSSGVLIGGCLSLFRNLCGTEFFPDLTNKILLIEDVSEYTYKIDLMLDQIKKSKNFDKIKGIVFGEFSDVTIDNPKHGSLDDVIRFFLDGISVPVIKNFKYGHIKDKYILPLGKEVCLDADNSTLKIEP